MESLFNEVTIRGLKLTCKHCGSKAFTHRSSQLNTAALTFFNLDWLNSSADVYVCGECGYLHWFLSPPIRKDLPPETIPADDTSVESTCVSCKARIPAGAESCPDCGWSYRSKS